MVYRNHESFYFVLLSNDQHAELRGFEFFSILFSVITCRLSNNDNVLFIIIVIIMNWLDMSKSRKKNFFSPFSYMININFDGSRLFVFRYVSSQLPNNRNHKNQNKPKKKPSRGHNATNLVLWINFLFSLNSLRPHTHPVWVMQNDYVILFIMNFVLNIFDPYIDNNVVMQKYK